MPCSLPLSPLYRCVFPADPPGSEELLEECRDEKDAKPNAPTPPLIFITLKLVSNEAVCLLFVFFQTWSLIIIGYLNLMCLLEQ